MVPLDGSLHFQKFNVNFGQWLSDTRIFGGEGSQIGRSFVIVSIHISGGCIAVMVNRAAELDSFECYNVSENVVVRILQFTDDSNCEKW